MTSAFVRCRLLYMAKDVAITVRMDPEMAAVLLAEAKERDIPVSQLIRETLRSVVAGYASLPREIPKGVPEGSESPKVTVVAQVGTEEPDVKLVCPHPKDKRTNVVGGKKCMVCGEVFP